MTVINDHYKKIGDQISRVVGTAEVYGTLAGKVRHVFSELDFVAEPTKNFFKLLANKPIVKLAQDMLVPVSTLVSLWNGAEALDRIIVTGEGLGLNTDTILLAQSALILGSVVCRLYPLLFPIGSLLAYGSSALGGLGVVATGRSAYQGEVSWEDFVIQSGLGILLATRTRHWRELGRTLNKSIISSGLVQIKPMPSKSFQYSDAHPGIPNYWEHPKVKISLSALDRAINTQSFGQFEELKPFRDRWNIDRFLKLRMFERPIYQIQHRETGVIFFRKPVLDSVEHPTVSLLSEIKKGKISAEGIVPATIDAKGNLYEMDMRQWGYGELRDNSLVGSSNPRDNFSYVHVMKGQSAVMVKLYQRGYTYADPAFRNWSVGGDFQAGKGSVVLIDLKHIRRVESQGFELTEVRK